jgi:hypothetical protein
MQESATSLFVMTIPICDASMQKEKRKRKKEKERRRVRVLYSKITLIE